MTPEEIKAMSAAKVAAHLTEHNKWRRGVGKYRKAGAKSPHTPCELGVIIERAIELLNGQKTKLEQIKLDILHLIDSEYDLAHGSDIRKVLNND